ncbi:MAG: hypothetical protein NWF01_01960 [Candidatus Bathyarchaeota archaeon]|nr:hypothetical protein [Candidatus Bathyarchaeota archaeon]
MKTITRHLKAFKQNRRGISTVIVVMLSLALLVTVVGNTVLWSYQMNQFDLDRIHENVNIQSANASLIDWYQTPLSYALGSQTTLINGTIANLTSPDQSYMILQSGESSLQDTYPISNEASDVDSSPNTGLQSNFTAQQYGPDGILDELSEVGIGGFNSQNWVDTSSAVVGSQSNFAAQQASDSTYDTLKEAQVSGDVTFGNTAEGKSYVSIPNNRLFGQAFTSGPTETTIKSVSFYGEHSAANKQAKVVIVQKSTFRIIENGISNPVTVSKTLQWHKATFPVEPKIEPNTDYILMVVTSHSTLYLYYTSATEGSEYIDETNSYAKPRDPADAKTGTHQYSIYATTSQTSSYQIDIQEHWEKAVYTCANEQLCVRTGEMSSEALMLQAWDGSSWQTVSSSLKADTWNNFSVTKYLTSASFSIRFTDGSQSGDNTQDSWQIESTLLHTWDSASQPINIEEQFTNIDYTKQNEQLCIYTGSWSHGASLAVQVWNGTWNTVIASLAPNSWNNVSVSSYLTTSDLTIRFLSTESGSSLNSWQIDTVLLNTWSIGYVTQVEFTGSDYSSSNVIPWLEIDWATAIAFNTSSVSVNLQLFNYSSGTYQTGGDGYLAYTSNSTPNTSDDKSQIITFETDDFRDSEGVWKLKLVGFTGSPFTMQVDYVQMHQNTPPGILMSLKNEGSLTMHIVAVWTDTATVHQRFDQDEYLNAGETSMFFFEDLPYPSPQGVIKVVTERGNLAVYS